MPYSKKAKFYHHRQKSPRLFDKKTFKNVPLNHTSYRGEKYSKWMYSGTPARAIVGRLKKSKKWSTQSILIPKTQNYVYAIYKKHQASRKWTRVGSYKFKRSAEKKAEEIKKKNKYMQTIIRKVRSYL